MSGSTGSAGVRTAFALDVEDTHLRPYDSESENWIGDCLLIAIDCQNNGGEVVSVTVTDDLKTALDGVAPSGVEVAKDGSSADAA